MAVFRKHLTDYFPKDGNQHSSRNPSDSPATEFLSQVVFVSDSVIHCNRRFTRKKDKTFTKDSSDSYQSIVTSSFALMMSHFETFQRQQFAEILNILDFLSSDDDLTLAKRLEKAGCNLSIYRLLGGRGNPREPGHIISDALGGWHDPEKVNRFFSLVFPEHCFYSNELASEIHLMWQIRHSIVHTGGIVTREDCMKHPMLKGYWDTKLVFDEGFILAVARRLHIIIQICLDGLRSQVEQSFSKSEGVDDIPSFIDSICGYTSPRPSWFKNTKAN